MSRETGHSEGRDRFERIFSDCHDAVFRYAARRVAAEAVQDVVSETFLVAWRRFDRLQGDPLPWLLGIARRVAANHRRSGARRNALLQRLRVNPPGNPAGPGPSLGDRELANAMAMLGERDREALMLVVWDGLEHRDAAKVMGCSTGALTVRVHRARRRLARALADPEPGRVSLVQNARSLS